MSDVAIRGEQPQNLAGFLAGKKNQIAAALPKHLDADRMIRLAVTCVMQNAALQNVSMASVYRTLLLSSQTGLEIGVGGQAYMVPYGGEATFVPGWQGLVDLVSRSGRATVWTGAVFEGDAFDWQLGDSPFVRHRPGGENDEEKLTHVYAIGRVKGAEYPVIEVWTNARIIKHRDKFNKVGKRHYSFGNLEMYARKVALLQVLKYMPKSIEMQRAVDAEHTAATGQQNAVVEGSYVNLGMDADAIKPEDTKTTEFPSLTEEAFATKLPEWTKLITNTKKTATQLIDMVGMKFTLTDEQKAAIRKIEADTKPEVSQQ